MDKDELNPPPKSPQRRRRSRSRSRSAKKNAPSTQNFLKKFKVEIFAGALLLLGTFLLVEKLEIRATLYSKLVAVTQSVSRLFSTVIGWGSGIEVSDFIGFLLVLGGVFLIGLRVRSRVISRNSHDKCPECGEAMKRVPSKSTHQILGLLMYVRIKRYACRKCSTRITLWESKHTAGNWQ